MANKLPWTTPKVQTLYTTSSVGRLIAEYLDAGGQMLQMREGVLGHGDVLLYDDAGKLKTYVIREVAINGSLDGENNFPIRLANTNFIL